MVKINTKQFAKDLKEATDYLADNKESGGCYRFHTVEMDDKGINKNVSIVLGWQDGYDTEISLYPDSDFEKVANDIVTEFNYVLSSWKSWEHE